LRRQNDEENIGFMFAFVYRRKILKYELISKSVILKLALNENIIGNK
jgi:hypothetical protein